MSRAGRFLFNEEADHAGKLLAVRKRPIVNDRGDVGLFRLEFEVFHLSSNDERRVFSPTGGVASQDVVISPNAPSDKTVKLWADALKVEKIQDIKAWNRLDQAAAARQPAKQRWIRLKFGPVDKEADSRQPFKELAAIPSPATSEIEFGETKSLLRTDFVRVSELRPLLKLPTGNHPSEDTLVKFIDKHRQRFGELLVKLTPKGQRKINWYLACHIWETEVLYSGGE